MAPPAKPASTPKRKPFTPKPSRPAEERLPKLYRALTDQVDDGYFENAIKTCKKSEFFPRVGLRSLMLMIFSLSFDP